MKPGDRIFCWYCNMNVRIKVDGRLPIHAMMGGGKCKASNRSPAQPAPRVRR